MNINIIPNDQFSIDASRTHSVFDLGTFYEDIIKIEQNGHVFTFNSFLSEHLYFLVKVYRLKSQGWNGEYKDQQSFSGDNLSALISHEGVSFEIYDINDQCIKLVKLDVGDLVELCESIIGFIGIRFASFGGEIESLRDYRDFVI